MANQPALALVDLDSFWIVGYFRETRASTVSPGNRAIVTLMGYADSPLTGTVHSLGWGIAQEDGSTGYNLLPKVSPTFEYLGARVDRPGPRGPNESRWVEPPAAVGPDVA